MEKFFEYRGYQLISRQTLSEHTVEITTEDQGLLPKLQAEFGFGSAICRGQTSETAVADARQLVDELLS